MAATPKIDRKISDHALRLLRDEVGGKIRGAKLYPIGPHVLSLCEPEPVVALSRRSYIAQVAAQQEGNVVEALRKAGLDAYCPYEPKKVRVNDRKHRVVKRAMLVGYIFPIFDEVRDNWQIIHPEHQGQGIKGIIRLFTVGTRPLPVADEVIQAIHEKEVERAGGRCASRPMITLEVGALVRILDPFSFAGLFGFITAVDQVKHFIGVELDIFGRKVPVWLEPEQVEVV